MLDLSLKMFEGVWKSSACQLEMPSGLTGREVEKTDDEQNMRSPQM